MTTLNPSEDLALALYLQTRNYQDFYIIADLDDPSGYRRQDPLWKAGDIIDRYPVDKDKHWYTYQKLKSLVLENLAHPDLGSGSPLIVAEFAVLPRYAKPIIGEEIPDHQVFLLSPDFWSWAHKARTRLICSQIDALSSGVFTYIEAGRNLLERGAYSKVLKTLLNARRRCGSSWRLSLARFL